MNKKENNINLDDLLDEILDEEKDVLEEDKEIIEESDDINALLDAILEDDSVEETVSKDSNKEVEKENKTGVNQNKEEIKPNKKKSKKPLIVIPLIILLVVGAYFVWDKILNFQEVEYFSIAQFELKGAEGHGSISLNKESIVYPDNKDIEKILKEVKLEFEPEENLKNGEMVKIEISNNEEINSRLKEFKYKLKSTIHELEVEDLGEINELNFFDALTLEFTDKSVDFNIDESKWKANKQQEELLNKVKVSSEDFETLGNGDKLRIDLEISEELEKELLKEGILIKEKNKDYLVEGLAEAPKSKDDIDILSELQAKATSKIDSDYQKNQQTYKNFKVVSVCYSNKPSNNVNYKDYHEGHSYKEGSLMFIFEFDQITSTSRNKMYDAYGYTNILSQDGKVLEEGILNMSPFQDRATVSSIKNEMKQNNFTCD